jgi:hypothetical protein
VLGGRLTKIIGLIEVSLINIVLVIIVIVLDGLSLNAFNGQLAKLTGSFCNGGFMAILVGSEALPDLLIGDVLLRVNSLQE